MKEKTRTLNVDVLARVEGEGAMHVRIKGDRVADVKLRIFEPPRFFEAFLRGRAHSEAPDITARICGICPVAYQMSSVKAMEAALDLRIPPPIRALRRLLYCGEWIESHTLHIYMLHAPDFLGYPDVLAMAKDHPEVVKKALVLKKTGNDLVALVGGREIHPVNVRVGGFYRAPTREELRPIEEKLHRAKDLAVETVRFAAGLSFPDLEPDHEFVSLSHPDEYPIDEGRIVSSRGLEIPAAEYEDHFEEVHVGHSNALHSVRKDGGGHYLVGPLARYSLCRDRLTPLCRKVAEEAGLGETCRNPFRSIVVRAVENLYAVEEALRLIASYERPDPPFVEGPLRAGRGCGATEAPRGLLYHRYTLDAGGAIVDAKITPPTAQNQPAIEDDLRAFLEGNLSLGNEALRARCETVIRNYDPCISCATHFLRLEVVREP